MLNIKFIKILKQRRAIFAALFVLVAILIIWTIFLWWKLFIASPSEEKLAMPESEVSSVATTTQVRRSIDGLLVPIEQASAGLFAVMIDNFPEARPSAGLSQASLVWEAPVEGGMTRFLAVFTTSTELTRLGPVRSARPYFLDWAKELNALYLHCGGSPQALADIKSKNIFDLNEFYRGWYFWRDKSRPRPYNIYSSSELINHAFQEESAKNNFAPREIESWLFKEEAPLAERGQATSTILEMGKVSVEWRYNPEENVYERWEDGAGHRDESGAVITAKNVIIQYATIKVLDEIGRRAIKTIGSGPAVIYRDGQKIEGRWQKENLTGRIRFFGPDTKEIEFNAGTSWVEVTSP